MWKWILLFILVLFMAVKLKSKKRGMTEKEFRASIREINNERLAIILGVVDEFLEDVKKNGKWKTSPYYIDPKLRRTFDPITGVWLTLKEAEKNIDDRAGILIHIEKSGDVESINDPAAAEIFAQGPASYLCKQVFPSGGYTFDELLIANEKIVKALNYEK